MVALSRLSETAAPGSESQKRVWHPAGRLDFKNPSLSNLEQDWCSQEYCSPPALQVILARGTAFLSSTAQPGGMLLAGRICLISSHPTLSVGSACISRWRWPHPGSVCLSLGYGGVWATSPGASALPSESRHGFKAEVGAELLTCIGGLAPTAFLGATEHPHHEASALPSLTPASKSCDPATAADASRGLLSSLQQSR